MYLILDSITRLMAPILPFTAEEIWTHMPEVQGRPESVHLSNRPNANPAWTNKALADDWEKIRELRAEVTKALEEARTAKLIGHPLDAAISIKAPTQALGDLLGQFGEDLRDIFIVSAAEVTDTLEGDTFVSSEIKGLAVKVAKASGKKCDRCWKYDLTVGDESCSEGACKRCSSALEKIAAIEG
jgi:isoleucyl-tRNA synthetase